MGLQTTLALGVARLIIEGQLLIVIQVLQEALEECPIEIRNNIANCKNLFSTFQSIVFKHGSRLKNRIANRLAKDGC